MCRHKSPSVLQEIGFITERVTRVEIGIKRTLNPFVKKNTIQAQLIHKTKFLYPETKTV